MQQHMHLKICRARHIQKLYEVREQVFLVPETEHKEG